MLAALFRQRRQTKRLNLREATLARELRRNIVARSRGRLALFTRGRCGRWRRSGVVLGEPGKDVGYAGVELRGVDVERVADARDAHEKGVYPADAQRLVELLGLGNRRAE